MSAERKCPNCKIPLIAIIKGGEKIFCEQCKSGWVFIDQKKLGIDGPEVQIEHKPAWYTYDPDANAWYFGRYDGPKPPYRNQKHVEAILDYDDNGELAGVEILL